VCPPHIKFVTGVKKVSLTPPFADKELLSSEKTLYLHDFESRSLRNSLMLSMLNFWSALIFDLIQN